MQRRELTGALLGVATGSALMAPPAEAQTCSPPCFPLTQAEVDHLCVANCASRRRRQLIQPAAVRLPSIIVESDHVAIGRADRSDTLQ